MITTSAEGGCGLSAKSQIKAFGGRGGMLRVPGCAVWGGWARSLVIEFTAKMSRRPCRSRSAFSQFPSSARFKKIKSPAAASQLPVGPAAKGQEAN
jgi:hypothetical protein